MIEICDLINFDRSADFVWYEKKFKIPTIEDSIAGNATGVLYAYELVQLKIMITRKHTV